MADTIGGQFAALGEAAAGCDVIVATTALQYAARSIAELRSIPYFFAAYSPVVLPSTHHAPPPLLGQVLMKGVADNARCGISKRNVGVSPSARSQRAAGRSRFGPCDGRVQRTCSLTGRCWPPIQH